MRIDADVMSGRRAIIERPDAGRGKKAKENFLLHAHTPLEDLHHTTQTTPVRWSCVHVMYTRGWDMGGGQIS